MTNKIFGITLIITTAVFASLACGGGSSVAEDTQQAVKIEMVKIPGGTFIMGSPEDEIGYNTFGDETQHTVTVSSFYMSKYEITQGQYKDVMGYNKGSFKGINLPVQASWYDAVEFCNKLSKIEGLKPVYTMTEIERFRNVNIVYATVTANWNKNGYRLPTEAEWEYACRAGTTTSFNTGNNITTEQANYDGNQPYNNNAKGKYRKKTTPVGSFAPNAWGLYDMHGNVKEWCWDWASDYSTKAQTNPKGPSKPLGAISGSRRVLRGGSWRTRADFLRSATRHSANPRYADFTIGFRVARN